jgi:hypothetical protein
LSPFWVEEKETASGMARSLGWHRRIPGFAGVTVLPYFPE